MERSRARILVVDDDTMLLELLVDTLGTIGYQTVGVCGGNEALERLRQERFDVMISDIKMPEMGGVELLEKSRRYYPKMPVLFITGVVTADVLGSARPDGFLAKPFRISHVEELIENTLTGKREAKGAVALQSELVRVRLDGRR